MSLKKSSQSHWRLKFISLLVLALILNGALIYAALQTGAFTDKTSRQGNWNVTQEQAVLDLGDGAKLKFNYGFDVDSKIIYGFNRDEAGHAWALPTTGLFQANEALKCVRNFSGHLELPKSDKVKIKSSRVAIASDNLLTRNYQSINKKVEQDFNFATQFTQFVNENSFFTMNFMAICVDFERDGKDYRAIMIQPGSLKEPSHKVVLPIY